MYKEVTQSRKSQIKGVVFCGVCMLVLYGMSRLASYILHRDVFLSDNYLIGFMILEMILSIVMIALLISPDVVLSVVTRIINKKIEDQTGCQDAIADAEKNESTFRTIMNKGKSTSKVVYRDKGLAQMLKYMQQIDDTVKTPKEFFEKSRRKEFARKYLNDILILISNTLSDEMAVLSLRFIYAAVYDLTDNHLVSKEDSIAKIENMRLLLMKLPLLSDDKECLTTVSELLFSIMRCSFQQDDYESVIKAYGLMQGQCLKDAEICSKRKSYMYEIVGASKLYLKEKNSIPYLKLSISYDPQNLSALLRLARYYFNRNDYVNAYDYAGRCFVVLPDQEDNRDGLNKIGDLLSQMMYMSAFALGKLDEAYSTIVAVDERSGNSASIKGNRAYLAFKCECYDEAEQCINQAWELDPNIGSVLNVRGMLFLRKGMYSKAIKAFKNAIKYFKPNKENSLERFFYGEICNNLAVALYKNAEKEAARKWFDKAIATCYPDVSVDIMDALPPIFSPNITK